MVEIWWGKKFLHCNGIWLRVSKTRVSGTNLYWTILPLSNITFFSQKTEQSYSGSAIVNFLVSFSPQKMHFKILFLHTFLMHTYNTLLLQNFHLLKKQLGDKLAKRIPHFSECKNCLFTRKLLHNDKGKINLLCMIPQNTFLFQIKSNFILRMKTLHAK